ncbi:MAG: hypothetical protein NVS2B7_28920 [Herpetosiphon sp.]
MNGSARDETVLRYRGWLWWRLPVVLLATGMIGYLTIAVFVADRLTVPVRRQVPRARDGWRYGTDPQRAFGVDFQDVTFPSRIDHVAISGWYIPGRDSQHAIVLVHGKDSCRVCEFQGRFLTFAQAMHLRGFSILLIDLRGHGASAGGHFTFGAREERDIEGAVHWLKGRGFRPGSIGLVGVSMGAANAIDATADDQDIGALVSDCSFADVYPVLQQEFPKASHLPGFCLPATVLMARFTVGVDIRQPRPIDQRGRIGPRPVLIIHGKADKLIPLAHAQRLPGVLPSAEAFFRRRGITRRVLWHQPADIYRAGQYLFR